MNSSPNQFSKSANSPESLPTQPSEPPPLPPAVPPVPPMPPPTASVPSPPVTPNTGDMEEKTEEQVLVSGGTGEEQPPPAPSGERSSESNPDAKDSEAPANSEIAVKRDEPIPPPSEPKQYRAVGLVQGRYTASDEQFTKGLLLTPDGTKIDAVLLGKVMSLVKNYLNLEQDHLWVVYPRTRQNDNDLHTQIMGVWEPEQLTKPKKQTNMHPANSPPDESGSGNDAIAQFEPPNLEDGYFSVRGEVVFQSQDPGYVVVKIKQAPRKQSDKPKFFKLKLNGTLESKAVGRFWDLHVQRQGDALVILQGNDMGFVTPKRKPPFKPRKGGRPPGKKPYDSKRPERPAGTKPTPQAPPVRREAPPKPVIKRNLPLDEG